MKTLRVGMLAVALMPLVVASAAVTGVVVDERGKPAVGATVWLTVYDGQPVMLRIVATTQTDTSGKFALDYEPPALGTATCAAYAPGMGFVWQTVEPKKTFAWLVLRPAVPLRARVVDEDGEPVGVAYVAPKMVGDEPVSGSSPEWELPAELRSQFTLTTDGDGYFIVPWLSATSHASVYAWTPTRACVQTRLDRVRPEVTMPQAGTVAGTLTCKEKPEAAAGVRVYGFTSKGDWWMNMIFATTDSSGHFQFDQVPPGVLGVDFDLDSSSWRIEKGVATTVVAGQTVSIEASLVRGVPVPGRVVEKVSRKPVPGIQVRGNGLALTDAQGRFTLYSLPGEKRSAELADWPADYYREQRGMFLPLDVEDAFGDPIPMKEVIVEIERARKIAVQVVDEHGKPVVGARITGNMDGQTAISGPDGRCNLTRLGTSVNYWLLAQTETLMPERVVLVPAGQAPVVATLPVSSKAGCRVRATIADGAGNPVPWARLEARGALRPQSGQTSVPQNSEIMISMVADEGGTIDGPLPSMFDYQFSAPSTGGSPISPATWSPEPGEEKNLGHLGGSPQPVGGGPQPKVGGFRQWLRYAFLRLRLMLR